jgi:hypothetical protein
VAACDAIEVVLAPSLISCVPVYPKTSLQAAATARLLDGRGPRGAGAHAGLIHPRLLGSVGCWLLASTLPSENDEATRSLRER